MNPGLLKAEQGPQHTKEWMNPLVLEVAKKKKAKGLEIEIFSIYYLNPISSLIKEYWKVGGRGGYRKVKEMKKGKCDGREKK